VKRLAGSPFNPWLNLLPWGGDAGADGGFGLIAELLRAALGPPLPTQSGRSTI